MEKIIIPDKTFRLYIEGFRTFIHVPRNESSLSLKETLNYRDPVTLINKDTDEQIEQRFWFLFDFKENDRFLIIVFEWSIEDKLFFERRRRARLIEMSGISSVEYISFLSSSQMWSFHMLMAYSAFFFINAHTTPGGTLYFLDDNEQARGYFVVLDLLKLKTEKGGIFEICSLFPIGLLNR